MRRDSIAKIPLHINIFFSIINIMEIYIVRHGTTVWNEKKRTQGRVNNRLSKNGKEKAKILAKKLKDICFDYIFSSPLLRSVQTANLINKYHNNKIIKDKRLTDIDQGIFTGRYFNSLTKEELVLKKSKAKSCNMETLEEMYFRIKPFFNEIVEKYKDKTVLIVTHSGVASFLEKMINYPHYDKNIFNSTDCFKNGQVKFFEYKK